jgi:hypothetical protein
MKFISGRDELLNLSGVSPYLSLPSSKPNDIYGDSKCGWHGGIRRGRGPSANENGPYLLRAQKKFPGTRACKLHMLTVTQVSLSQSRPFLS